MLRGLVKYVLVTTSGTWLDMSSNPNEIPRLARKHPECFVERWIYPMNPDGTHGAPFKVRLPQENPCSPTRSNPTPT